MRLCQGSLRQHRLGELLTAPPPDDGPPVMKQVLDKMSNLILNEQEDFCNKMDSKLKQAMIETLKETDTINNNFFKEGSTTIEDMSNHVRNHICHLLDSNKELSKYAGALVDTAKNKTAAEVEKKPARDDQEQPRLPHRLHQQQKKEQLPKT